MNAFDKLLALPGLRELFDLAWRTFGVAKGAEHLAGKTIRKFVVVHGELSNFAVPD